MLGSGAERGTSTTEGLSTQAGPGRRAPRELAATQATHSGSSCKEQDVDGGTTSPPPPLLGVVRHPTKDERSSLSKDSIK